MSHDHTWDGLVRAYARPGPEAGRLPGGGTQPLGSSAAI